MKLKYLPGLNSLRFFAAFFVVISHGNISLDKLGIHPASNLALLNRGGDAVDFFFTLSGFLITYLLINEIDKTSTVSIRQFYLRRVYRIWPLYFLIVAIGFFLLGYVYPKIYHHAFFNFSIPEGLLMFIFFVPNYAAKNYFTGLLNPLWSIGVEEQFYLFWAPLVKYCRGYLQLMIGIFVIISLLFYTAVYYHLFNIPANWEMFLLTQKFYAMAIGSAFGYLLFYKYDWFNKSIFASRQMQLLVLLVISWHYLVGSFISDLLIFKILLAFLYGLLMINISAASKKLIKLEMPFLSYLGVISFGIYMYHMPVDYLLRTLVPRLHNIQLPVSVTMVMYYVLLLSGTIIVAAFSHRYFESYFLKLKDRLHPQRKPA
ncbi:MAG: acyltransferase [Ferruginibacter sp.]